jgi:nitrite reductase/ring-hydroxylating ferredoxin subunit
MSQFFEVATIHEIPPGHSKTIPVQGREILVVNDRGTFYAIKNSCPHRGMQLTGGTVEEAILTCPGHSWRFDLKTGDALDHPPMGLRCYRIEIRRDAVWVEVPDLNAMGPRRGNAVG